MAASGIEPLYTEDTDARHGEELVLQKKMQITGASLTGAGRHRRKDSVPPPLPGEREGEGEAGHH